VAGTPIATEGGSVAIEKLKVGDRVLTGTGESRTEIVSAQWRKISVATPNPEQPADTLWIDMLRSTQWVSTASCRVGGQVWIELDEIGYRGWAKVRAVEPCPEIRAGEGRVVTATLNHYNSHVYELKLQHLGSKNEDGGISSNGEQSQILNQKSSLLNPTDRHPIFSETRQDWVPALDLKPGEMLRTANGSVRLESVDKVPGTHRVYNLEVEEDHQYYAGEAEVLSHNTGAGAGCGPRGHPNPTVGHQKPWATMTKKEQAAFQHSYSRHGSELGLPNWQHGKAAQLQVQFNRVVAHLRETGTLLPGPIYKPWNGASVRVNFFESTIHGKKYYYYEDMASGTFISAGLARP
jgi:hypothetical protein